MASAGSCFLAWFPGRQPGSLTNGLLQEIAAFSEKEDILKYRANRVFSLTKTGDEMR